MNRGGSGVGVMLLLGAVFSVQGCAAEAAPSFEAACRAGPGSPERAHFLERWDTPSHVNARLSALQSPFAWAHIVVSDFYRAHGGLTDSRWSVLRAFDRVADEWQLAPASDVREREVSMTFVRVDNEGMTTRVETARLRRCGQAISIDRGDAAGPSFGVVHADLGFFIASVVDAAGDARATMGFVNEADEMYAVTRDTVEWPDGAALFVRPEGLCPQGVFGGGAHLDVWDPERWSSPMNPYCSAPDSRGAEVELSFDGDRARLRIEPSAAIDPIDTTGRLDASCNASLAFADGRGTWSVFCGPANRCIGFAEEHISPACRNLWHFFGF